MLKTKEDVLKIIEDGVVDKSEVFIEDVDEGWTKINNIVVNEGDSNWVNITLKDNRLSVTSDHPFIGENGCEIRASSLKKGDFLLDNNKNKLEILDIEYDNTIKTSYDVETDSHTFVFSGVYSHNCRTFVEGDSLVRCDSTKEPSKRYKFERNERPPYGVTFGRGNFNFVTMNLPKFAIDAIKNTKGAKIEALNTSEVIDETVSRFYRNLLFHMIGAKNILKIRQSVIGKKQVRNFSFIVGQNLVLGSEGMKEEDQTNDLWEHFSKSIGYIGMYETLYLLFKKDQVDGHKESLEIISFMRKVVDNLSKGYYIAPTEKGLQDKYWYKDIFNVEKSTFCNKNLEKSEWDEKFQVYDIDNNPICIKNKNKLKKGNWSLFATPAEGACMSFCKTDLREYGKIKNVTDKGYYTNSNHVDVRNKISVEEKIGIEAPFHTLANAGNIFYVEADGVVGKNTKAYKDILYKMHDAEMGYVAINVPSDFCEVCRYHGVIPEGEGCPHCGASEENITRIRRITGYLTPSVNRWNGGKRAELKNRVKHTDTK